MACYICQRKGLSDTPTFEHDGKIIAIETLRDRFAMAALKSMNYGCWPGPGEYEEIADISYAIADAMMLEREKKA